MKYKLLFWIMLCLYNVLIGVSIYQRVMTVQVPKNMFCVELPEGSGNHYECKVEIIDGKWIKKCNLCEVSE